MRYETFVMVFYDTVVSSAETQPVDVYIEGKGSISPLDASVASSAAWKAGVVMRRAGKRGT